MNLVNPGFEDTSGAFPTGWTKSGTVSATAGLVGASTTAANLATGASLSQDFAALTSDGLTDFTFQAAFRIAETDAGTAVTANTYRLRLRGSGVSDLLSLRLGPAGIEAYNAGIWVNAVALALGEDTTCFVRVTGTAFGSALRSYRVAVSTDGVNFVTGPALAAFHNGTEALRFETVVFEAGATSGTSLKVDDVSVASIQLLLNSGFETLPFPTAWTSSSGAVSTTGLNASTTAARLPYNTSAKLSQSLLAPAADFTADLSFQVAGTNEAQALHWFLAAGGAPLVELRTSTGGILQVNASGNWLDLVRLTDGATFAVPASQTMKLRVIGRGFGTSAAAFDIAWSEAGGTTLVHAAAGLTAFASSAALSSPVDGVVFQHEVVAGNSFTVDDVGVAAAAALPPTADYKVVVPAPDKVVCLSGIYPHLAMTNTLDECGIGAVVPWAGKLWAITYGPHQPTGSTDKLYEIGPDLARVVRPESVGGTPANRFIHGPSNQLIIGPYFIDASRNVRVLTSANAPGRFTATAAHLSDPVNRVYLFTMEDGLYDVNVNDLSVVTRYPDVQGTGDTFLSGYHGKGAYSGQGLLVVGNNGEPDQTMPSGVLATWNGTTLGSGATPERMAAWNEIERIQTCEITGPGGLRGNPNPATDPLWTTGFDAKSVVLHTLESGTWHTWRLPKGSCTHDGAHGWHTEWPRIRQIDPDNPASPYLMHMHGMFYRFPKTFSAADFAGLEPISSYHKMPVDYCWFGGRIVMAKDDTSRFSNALVPKAQSNLWFGQWDDLRKWGAPGGHGAVWLNEAVVADQVSDPFLVQGFAQGTLHLRNLGASPVEIGIEASTGTGAWSLLRSVSVPAGGYVPHPINALGVPWVRLRAGGACSSMTASFHLRNPYPHTTPASAGSDEFAALADIRDTRSISDGVIRVMNNSALKLEFASSRVSPGGSVTTHRYHQIGGDLVLNDVSDATSESTLRTAAATTQEFGSDSASAWVTEGSVRFRLPKLDPLYDTAFAGGWARGFREVVTERQLLNCHGSLYEVPRDISGGYRKMRVLCTHGKRLTDFASWRGLLVLTGVLDSAPAADNLVRNADGTAALWLGEVDDLWRMGEPRGTGGPWKETLVTTGAVSDPYLMYGYDRKEVLLSADAATTITLEVDFLGDNTWSAYREFPLAANVPQTFLFPDGFHAHWVRARSSAAATATVQFAYGPAARRDRFLDWARDHGLPTGGGRGALAGQDSDGDGLGQLLEFVTNGDPAAAGANPLVAHRDGAEFVACDLAADDAITLDLQVSSDLTIWQSRPDLLQPAPDQTGLPAGFTRMKAAYPSGADHRFLRLQAGFSRLEN